MAVRFLSQGAFAFGIVALALGLCRPAGGEEKPAFPGWCKAFVETKTTKLVWAVLQPDGIEAVAVSPDGKLALTGSFQKITVRDVATGKELRAFRGDSDGPVLSVAFSADGKLALSGGGSWPPALTLWHVATGQALRTFRGHGADVRAVAFSPDGKLAASGSEDSTLRLWDIFKGSEVRRIDDPVATAVEAVAFSPDGKLVLATGATSMKLRNVATGEPVRDLELKSAYAGNVHSVAFSADGKLALSGHSDCARLWDVSTGKELRALHTEGELVAAAFAADGKLVVSGGLDGALMLWDADTGAELDRIDLGKAGRIGSLAPSPDGRSLLVGMKAGSIFGAEGTVLRLDLREPDPRN